MATAISGFLHTSGSKSPACLFHELPKFLHLGDAFDGQADDLSMGFYPESLFGSGKRPLVDKKGFALQFRFHGHLSLQKYHKDVHTS
jgi:hypothetical protein